MGKGTFRYETIINAPLSEVWDFFKSAENLAVITSFPKIKLSSDPRTVEGNLIEMELDFGVMKKSWVASIVEVKEKEYFIDTGLKLPFPFVEWKHQHRFEAVGKQTKMTDIVNYKASVPNLFVTLVLKQMFTGRKKVLVQKLTK
ncbi:SRPBCC family protein [Alkalihalobacterium elongatum]|uniref:SRPBCC family protein n=1 Tax=Alkalihalobacterium elongatum TaxID=2675466 RepID=UPI001C1F6E06|nr:SRPBCC family protein [Alkalihalobacterium elongatum]